MAKKEGVSHAQQLLDVIERLAENCGIRLSDLGTEIKDALDNCDYDEAEIKMRAWIEARRANDAAYTALDEAQSLPTESARP